MKSILASRMYDSPISRIYGRIIFAISLSMRMTSRRSSASSSRILLFASRTSVGSMKTVFPDADSSCTMPCILRFREGTTGITSRPSRIAGETSLSTSPSLFALFSIEFNVRDILPRSPCSSRLSLANSGDAVSRRLPRLSIICSIL